MDTVLDSILDLFAIDDGSLPEVCIQGLAGPEVEGIYTHLRQATRFLVGSPVFRHRIEHLDKALHSVPNAAALVVSGEADPFHFLTRSLAVGEVKLPDLGVFVFDNALALDYEKGPAWGKPQILGFFELLRTLFAKAVRPQISFDADSGKNENERFTRALSTFCAIAFPDKPGITKNEQ